MESEGSGNMGVTQTFSEVVEAVERLSPEEQETLVGLVQRRLAERRRGQIAQEIAEAREEYAGGRCRGVTVDDLMTELRK